jgi:hypothetical protein
VWLGIHQLHFIPPQERSICHAHGSIARTPIDVSIIQDNALSTGSKLRKCENRHVIPAQAGIQWFYTKCIFFLLDTGLRRYDGALVTICGNLNNQLPLGFTILSQSGLLGYRARQNAAPLNGKPHCLLGGRGVSGSLSFCQSSAGFIKPRQ